MKRLLLLACLLSAPSWATCLRWSTAQFMGKPLTYCSLYAPTGTTGYVGLDADGNAAIATTVLGPKTLAAGANQLPAAAAGNAGQLTRVTDAANALDCTGAGGGTAIAFCYSNGSAWSAPFGSISGTATLGTDAITANNCASAVTVAATGVATTDVIHATFNADVSGVTGYGKASTDGLIVYAYPTSGNVNFKVCNGTGASITPGAATLNWRVAR